MATAQLEKFEEWGAERANAAIEYTIRQGWQGLREPDESGSRATSSDGVSPGMKKFLERHRKDELK